MSDRPGVHDEASHINHQPFARLRLPPPVYVGHCAATRAVQTLVHRAVRTRAPVLLSGAPGTGKRTVAELLYHFAGGEARELSSPTLDDGRVPKLGQFNYLCPIEALSLEQQGELAMLAPRWRMVLATRLDPDSDEGQRRLHPKLVRERLHIRLPTLRERVEDLEALALRVVYTSPSRRPVGGIDDYALDCLRAYPWPGNVTELEEVLRQAIAAGEGEQIELRDLPPHLRLRAVEGLDLDSPEFEFSLVHAERTAIERALRYVRGNKRKAARLLRISKTTLYRKLRLLDAEPE